MPVEFLTDEEAAAYGAYHEAPSRAKMEQVLFLDAVDRRLVTCRRGDHNRSCGPRATRCATRTWSAPPHSSASTWGGRPPRLRAAGSRRADAGAARPGR